MDHLDLSSPEMQDLGNWHWLFRGNECRDRLNPAMNYCYGVPTFIKKTLKNGVRDSTDLQGWPSVGQRGPTCGYNGPTKAFQYLLRRFGFSKSDIKEVTHSARLFWMMNIGCQLAAIRNDAGNKDAPLSAASIPNAGYGSTLWTGAGMDSTPREMQRVISKTVWEMIDIGCHNLSGSALKLHDRGRLNENGLRLSLALCRRVRQLLPPPSMFWFALPKPLPMFKIDQRGETKDSSSSSAEQVSSSNQPLELLIDWPEFNLDSKAGPKDSMEFPLKLAASMVLENFAKATTLEELLPALKECVSICQGIRERFEDKGEVAISKLHVLGLLHSCFASGLGAAVPFPHESRSDATKSKGKKRSNTSSWTSGKISAQMQEQAIECLLQLGCELAAATKSLPETLSTSALDKISLGAMTVAMDSVICAVVNCHGNDATSEEKKKGEMRVMLWREDYLQLGLYCMQRTSATDVQGGSVLFADTTADCPISWPGAVIVRADVQAYLDSARVRELGGDKSKPVYFLDMPDSKDDVEACFWVPANLNPVEPTAQVFRKLAVHLGYHPAQEMTGHWNEAFHLQHITKNGKFIPPHASMGKKYRDFPDSIVRQKALYNECIENGVELDGTPDKDCGTVAEGMLAIDWMFGSELNNKILAHPLGKSLCRVRDMILLMRLMLEPRNTNGRRPVTGGLKPGKFCPWTPEHARPTLTKYGCEFNSSSIYLGTRVATTAFNRTWNIGRSIPKADCSLDGKLISPGIKWDASAALRPEKNEDDVLHASKIPNFGGALSTEDSEALLSFLSVPGLRVSLVLQFFAEKSRLTALFNESLRRIVWSSTFCPDRWPLPTGLDANTGEAEPQQKILQVPAASPSRLRSRQGLLFVELRTAPELVLRSCVMMVTNATDVASVGDFLNPYTSTFFFTVRLAVAVLDFARTVSDTFGSSRHWPKDGFQNLPSSSVKQALSAGIQSLTSVLLKQAIPLVQTWIDQALAAGNGMEEKSDNVDADDQSMTTEPVNPAIRLAEELARQGSASEMSITANAHMVLLSSPALCGGSAVDYSLDDVGMQLISSSLKSMAYVVEWHGKSMGASFFGSSALPPTLPPEWSGNKAHMVCSGSKQLWPPLDVDSDPLWMSDYDPGVLGVSPHELWSTLAKRRKAVMLWIQDSDRSGASDRIIFLLSGMVASSLGDANYLWPSESNIARKESESRLTHNVFTRPDGRMRVDAIFAEINFLSAKEGIIRMPDSVGADADLQEIITTARGGVESSIMPHVVAKQIHKYMQSYDLPSVTNGDKGLELQYWSGVPLLDSEMNRSSHIILSGFPSGCNGKYEATSRICCNEPIYVKRFGGNGQMTIRKTDKHGRNESTCRGDRYHLENSQNVVLAFNCSELPIGVPRANTGWHFAANDGGWVEDRDCSCVLLQDVSVINFGAYVSAPKEFHFDGRIGVHSGGMDGLSEEEGWIRFDIFHRQGGLHDLFLSYTAQDSRPCRLRVNGQEFTGIAAQVTGGWGHDTIQTMTEPECRVDLGSPSSFARVEFRAEGFCPHLSTITFDPIDGRRDVEGMPLPQDYTGSSSSRSYQSSSIDSGETSEISGPIDLEIVTFRNCQYGGKEESVCRWSDFRNCDFSQLLVESRIPGSSIHVGGRNREDDQVMWGNVKDPSKAKPEQGTKWRLTAPRGTGSGGRWSVQSLEFLDVAGVVIPCQKNSHALSCGSMSSEYGPEYALNCEPEKHVIDDNGASGKKAVIVTSMKDQTRKKGSKVEKLPVDVRCSLIFQHGTIKNIMFKERDGFYFIEDQDGNHLQVNDKGFDGNNYFYFTRFENKNFGEWERWSLEKKGSKFFLLSGKNGECHQNTLGFHSDPEMSCSKYPIVNKQLSAAGEGFTVVLESDVETDSGWVGMLEINSGSSDTGAKSKGQMLYIGVEFPEAVRVDGFMIQQGANRTKMSMHDIERSFKNKDKKTKTYGLSDYAREIALEVYDDYSKEWVTIKTFTMRESKWGEKCTRKLGQTAGGKIWASLSSSSSSSSPKKQINVDDTVLGKLSKSGFNWISELLIRCTSNELQSLYGDNVVLLFPTTHQSSSTTVLMCDPAKPSPNRWSLMMLDRGHKTVNVFGLREFGRRCVTQHVWTSNYQLSKHEIEGAVEFGFKNSTFNSVVPNAGPLPYQPHPWAAHVSGSFFDNDASRGGWSLGTPQRPTMHIMRQIDGNEQVLIPSRFMGGILPDCLTETFRFWRDQKIHTITAEKRQDADETWFSYELEVFISAASTDFSSSSSSSSSKSLGRTKSKVRVRSQMVGTINNQIQELKKDLAVLQKKKEKRIGKKNVTEKAAMTKRLQNLIRKRQEILRAANGSEGGANNGVEKLVNPRNADLLPGSLHYDVWRSQPDVNDATFMIRHQLVDFTSPDVESGTWLSSLCSLLLRIENAAHILVWAACDYPHGKSKELIELHQTVEIIELPRLGLKFTTSFNREGTLRVMSAEHDGLFIITEQDVGTKEEDEDLRRVAAVSPFNLMLGDETGNRFLMIPNYPYDCSNFLWSNFWQNRIKPLRNDQLWLQTFKVRVFVYKIHESRLFCEMPSLAASFLWAFLQCADRRYTQAAQTIDCMSSDEWFTPTELFLCRQFIQLYTEQIVTDAFMSLMMKMRLKFKDSPEVGRWTLPCGSLVATSAHIPAACRISHEEELWLEKKELTSSIRGQYIRLGNKGGTQLLRVNISSKSASGHGESFMNFALGKGGGSAHSLLKDAQRKILAAEKKYENAGGWVRLDNTYMHDYRNRRGPPRDPVNDVFDTLEAAKKEFLTRQNHAEERERPCGITFYEHKYGLRFGIGTDRSGSFETSWVRIYQGGIDPRGSRASLWSTKSLMYTPPLQTRLSGRDLLGPGKPLSEFLHDELDGSAAGLGFLFAAQVLGEKKYILSVDGQQNNSETLMSQAIHIYFSDRGCNGVIGLDNSVPMAILAVLATHKAGSIPNFPKLEQSHMMSTEKAREVLRKGETAGCIDGLHRHVREQTNPSKDEFRYHAGGYMAQAVKATLDFLNSKLELKTRSGVALYEPPRPREDYIMPPDPSIVKLSDDGKYAYVPVVTLDNRYARKLPRPLDFSNDKFVLRPSDVVVAQELVELATFPLLSVLHTASLTTQPPLPSETTAGNLLEFLSSLEKIAEQEEAVAQSLKSNDKQRPKLPLPIPTDGQAASSPIGSAMIKRFEQSMVDFKMRVKQIKRDQYSLNQSLKTLDQVALLHQACKSLLQMTTENVRRESKEMEYALNTGTVQAKNKNNNQCGYTGVIGYLRHQLMKVSWLEPHVEVPFLLGSVLSSQGVAQLLDANPFLDAPLAQRLIDRAALLMLRTSRVTQLRRTLTEIQAAFPAINSSSGGAKGGLEMPIERISTSSIAKNLTARRYWTKVHPDGSISFDPRFLTFEFISGYMMWERQTNLIHEFHNAAITGSSETQQMIMGDGKTTVVGPMLALMLGGKRGVTLVCPKALMMQTKQIMRQIFSAPLSPKPVLTLVFDRGCNSKVSSLKSVREKLEGAQKDLGIVIASPASIKSYFLKYIELLVMLKANRTGGRKSKSQKMQEEKAWARKKKLAQQQLLLQQQQQQAQQQEPAAQIIMQIQVPQGCVAGQMIQMQAPSGQILQYQIPQGKVPGNVFPVSVPGAVPGGAVPGGAVPSLSSAAATTTAAAQFSERAMNDGKKWYRGPLTWRTGTIPKISVFQRPDENLPFIPSRICVLPAFGAKISLEIFENCRIPYRFPKGTVVDSAWYVDRSETYGIDDPKYIERY